MVNGNMKRYAALVKEHKTAKNLIVLMNPPNN